MYMKALLPGITILVCTYNGARNLPATLKHLAAQQCDPGLAWEIILVDNASTDGSLALGQKVWSDLGSPAPLTSLQELRKGKDNAVDRGLEIAAYSYVVICDDDNWLEEHYVQRAYKMMEANPRIGMLGGRGIPVFTNTPPPWFTQLENYYAVGGQNPASGEVITSKGFLWGAGAVINAAAYQALTRAGFERIITFANCPEIARGEDIELCLAIKLAGYKIWYDDQLIFQHYITREKLEWDYVTRLVKEGGAMSAIVGIYKAAIKQKKGAEGSFIWLRKLVRQLTKLEMIKLWWYVKTRDGEGDQTYLHKLGILYSALGYLRFNNRYDLFVKRIFQLKDKLHAPGA
jgi:glycosyltransferase involved in cell wall biosynthesis